MGTLYTEDQYKRLREEKAVIDIMLLPSPNSTIISASDYDIGDKFGTLSSKIALEILEKFRFDDEISNRELAMLLANPVVYVEVG